jgi:hypothetical protein
MHQSAVERTLRVKKLERVFVAHVLAVPERHVGVPDAALLEEMNSGDLSSHAARAAA